jgi:SWI/SNF-related matrix-associated actin-dependent regulator 1 of chromatin subfamily A
VLHWLPSKIRKQIFLHVDNSIKSTSATFTTREAELESQMDAFQLSESSMQQFQASTPKKLASIIRYLNDLLVEAPKELGNGAEAPKILLFAHHKTTMDALEDWLDSVHIPSIRIDGETCASKRQTICNSFQSESRIKVALLSITAASTGLTLTASSLVIFAELFWNPGTLIQAEDRAHRIGQKDSVIVHYLLGKGTFDDVMWPILVRKMKTLQAVGLGKNEFGGEGANEIHQQDATIMDSRQKTLLQFGISKQEQ